MGHLKNILMRLLKIKKNKIPVGNLKLFFKSCDWTPKIPFKILMENLKISFQKLKILMDQIFFKNQFCNSKCF